MRQIPDDNTTTTTTTTSPVTTVTTALRRVPAWGYAVGAACIVLILLAIF